MELIRGETSEALHATLWEAVHAGIVFRLESAYKFLHDSIQEAAYALIPEELRAERHLRIARLLVANLTPDELRRFTFVRGEEPKLPAPTNLHMLTLYRRRPS